MSDAVWVDGALHAATDPIITAGNHGFAVGDGVFETIAVRQGLPLALTRHLVRLAYSLDRMGLAPVESRKVREGVAAVIEAGLGAVVRVRVTAVAGEGPAGLRRGPGAPMVVITGSTTPPPAACRAVRAPWRRNERSAIVGVKSTSYAENVVISQFAAAKGADEALLANTLGHLCEGTGTNVFIERGGEVLTPPLASGCLAGIARGLALELGARAGIPMRVAAPGELGLSVLDDVVKATAHAAVTSSTRGVQPVERLDGHDVDTGPLIARLMVAYAEGMAADPDPEPPRQRDAS